ncbi:MAG TPA: sigma-70 family RNA polymerase sigma factor [Candidatus Binatia bacterium]|jgi:RNA polymerase sigma factor (sigma-70 family)|nr:sigma-70 family RNA polymerase sigma factor [Candidatus Binatia bacterium]
MSDWELLSAYVQGDERAFEALFAKYFRMVYTTAMRQVGDPHLAEEVAQSVFIIFSRKASKLSSSVSVCGWLLQATRFVSRDAVKMRLRRHQHEQEFAASLDRDSAPTTDGSALGGLLDEALLALHATDQAGVLAHFYEGKNFKEIGEMLAISEDAAQKRISRSLDKLRALLAKRGAKVPAAALAGLLTAQFAHEAAAQALPAALHAVQAAMGGTFASGNVLVLANRGMRLLRWRFASGLGLKLLLPVALLIGGAWAAREWSSPSRSSNPRIEALAKRWSVMDVRIAGAKKQVAQIPPTDPRFQALLAQVTSVAADAEPIRDELNRLLTPAQGRDQVAEFLALEIGETLKLERSERRAVFALVRERLGRGATLTDAMKAMAQDIPAEAVQIKAVLSPVHRQSFDSIYGADGSCLFVYLVISTAGK